MWVAIVRQMVRIPVRPVCLVLVVLAVAGLTSWSLLRPATAFPGAHFNQHRNAAWLDIVWVMEPQAPEAITALAQRLRH